MSRMIARPAPTVKPTKPAPAESWPAWTDADRWELGPEPTPTPEPSAPTSDRCTCGPLFLCGACLDGVIALRATEPAPFAPSAEDLAHNAENSPSNREGFFNPDEATPFDLELRTVSALAWWNEHLDPEPTEASGDWR